MVAVRTGPPRWRSAQSCSVSSACWVLRRSAAVPLRSKFQMTLYFHVLDEVAGSWKVFLHFDGKGQRFQGDHWPIEERCATSFWKEGDYIVDTFTVEAGDITFEAGDYAAKLGFFTGTNPNWKNMKVSAAPDGAADEADRVTIGSIRLE